MKTKKHQIFIPDSIIDLARNSDLILFGIETGKTLDNEEFGRAVDDVIDLCSMDSDLYKALVESLKLQKHYASLLNQYDDGKRIGFDSPEEWIARLKELKKLEA
jgi:hypothetical protein